MRSFILVLFSMALAFTSANAEVKKGTTTFEAVKVEGVLDTQSAAVNTTASVTGITTLSGGAYLGSSTPQYTAAWNGNYVTTPASVTSLRVRELLLYKFVIKAGAGTGAYHISYNTLGFDGFMLIRTEVLSAGSWYPIRNFNRIAFLLSNGMLWFSAGLDLSGYSVRLITMKVE